MCTGCSGAEDSRQDAGAPSTDDAADEDTANDAADGAAPAPSNTAGTFTHDLVVDDQTRELIVYVPESAAGADPVPAVFMIHGTGQSGQHFYDESGWRAQADEVGAIVVFPTALTYCYFEDENRDGDFSDEGERRVSTKWSSGRLGDPDSLPLCTADEIATLPPANREAADHPFVDDVNFMDAMVDLLGETYAVDARRLYVTGFSNGASFTQRLVVERSEVFAAFAANAAGLTVEPAPAERAASVFFTVGNRDEKVFGPDAIPLPMEESLATTPEFRDRLIAPLLATLRLDDVYEFSDQTTRDVRFLRWSYTTSLAGASNRLDVHVIEGLAHVYPDYMPRTLWAFFENYSLP